MSNEPKDEKPSPHDIVVAIVDAAHKLRRHEGQFLSAVVFLERAIEEIHRNLKPIT